MSLSTFQTLENVWFMVKVTTSTLDRYVQDFWSALKVWLVFLNIVLVNVTNLVWFPKNSLVSLDHLSQNYKSDQVSSVFPGYNY